MDACKSFLVLCLTIGLSGCSLLREEPFWCPPGLPGIQHCQAIQKCSAAEAGEAVAELELAIQYDRAGSPKATYHYFRAIERLWAQLDSGHDQNLQSTRITQSQLMKAYHQSLARFLVCAQRSGQYVPGTGVVLQLDGEIHTIPVRLEGLPWAAEDLQSLHPVGDYHAESPTRRVKRNGWGIPVVARRTCATHQHPGEQFLLLDSSFPVTAVLRVDTTFTEDSDVAVSRPVLEFYNSQTVDSLSVTGGSRPLAADLSAAFAFQEICGAERVDPFEWFIHPEMDNEQDGLFFLEPWQPGKIPVVMIHGLLSSPRTWVNMANELRSRPGFCERYQIWGFRYATGQPFVTSAAMLRRDLNRAVGQLKATSDDRALDQIVLLGHSMGGLIAKAQISCSEHQMWNAVANHPLAGLKTDAKTRQELHEQFYFEPQPSVRRVIFVAVPHGGSTLATRFVGHIGSALVQADSESLDWHQRLMKNNPRVFSREVRRKPPTSIDLLKSESPLLQALYKLPVSQHVKLHSIIGNGRCSLGDGFGDGVVGIKSARHPGVVSECYIPTTHTAIHGRPETVNEVWRILCEHHCEYIAPWSSLERGELPGPGHPGVVPEIPETAPD